MTGLCCENQRFCLQAWNGSAALPGPFSCTKQLRTAARPGCSSSDSSFPLTILRTSVWQVTYHKRRYEPCVDFFKTHCHEYYCILLSVEPTTDEKLVIRRELTTGREMAASDSASSASRTIPPPGPASDHAYPSGYASGPRARWFTALCTASRISRSQSTGPGPPCKTIK